MTGHPMRRNPKQVSILPLEREGRNGTGPKAPVGDQLEHPSTLFEMPLWQLDIVELTGHNLEARGREEVNRLLQAGWRLLHIYTLKYREEEVWRERPMAILGRLRQPVSEPGGAHEPSSTNNVPEHPVVGSR